MKAEPQYLPGIPLCCWLWASLHQSDKMERTRCQSVKWFGAARNQLVWTGSLGRNLLQNKAKRIWETNECSRPKMVHCNQPASVKGLKGQHQVRINSPPSQAGSSPGLSCQGAALTHPDVQFFCRLSPLPQNSSAVASLGPQSRSWLNRPSIWRQPESTSRTDTRLPGPAPGRRGGPPPQHWESDLGDVT